MKKERFHHGNLRAEIVKVAMVMLNDKGIDSLSMRGIAKELNVSSAAHFRHFKNKDELLLVLADEVILKLLSGFEEAINLQASDEQRLSHACLRYLHFAEESPHLFQLLFNSDFSFSSRYRERYENRTKYAAELLQKLVASVIPPEVNRDRSDEITASCWALLHGYATLSMGRHLDHVSCNKDYIITSLINMIRSSD